MQVKKGITPEGKEVWIVLSSDYSVIIPIHDYLRYLENKNYSPNTIKAYARNLKLYWEFLQEIGIDWTKITILNLSEFIHWLKTTNSKVVNWSQPTACRTERTINHILKTVRLFYEFQSRLGAVDDLNVYQTKRIDKSKLKYKSLLHHTQSGMMRTNILKLKEPKTFPGCLTKSEVFKLIDGCNNLRDKFLICLLYETGMRIGEALGLRHEDIRSKGVNEIHVVDRDDNINRARAKTGDRVIHVSKELMRMYSTYLVNEYPEVDSDYVFVNCWKKPLGEAMSKSNVDNLFTRLALKTGVKAHPHLLRHTHATELIRANWDMAHVQKRLGHSDIQTTVNTYVHLNNEDLAQKYQEYLETQK
ncbi:MAG: tyrosine-type recombinase/integrase [Scytonema sp. PMC 1069.18]|nr:tyrosine-type recombinase/integrase [Scytonema sp. PMC 1069.18]MEC4888205.1 tyrosine-type recombinase/integrase [Scytonema sp. PMC 1070.18]